MGNGFCIKNVNARQSVKCAQPRTTDFFYSFGDPCSNYPLFERFFFNGFENPSEGEGATPIWIEMTYIDTWSYYR